MKPEGRLVIEMPLNKAALWPTLTANWQQDELFRPANTSDTKRPRRFGVLHRAGQPMLTQWVLLQMPHLRVARIGNIIWAIASLIGIARTRGFQPRAISSDFSKLQAIFPALDLKLVHPSTRVEPVAEERKGMMYEPWLVDVPPNSAISGYLQSHRYFENHTAEIRRMFRFNNEVLPLPASHHRASAARQKGIRCHCQSQAQSESESELESLSANDGSCLLNPPCF